MKIILASGSPRRKELLQELTTNFEIITNDFDEEYIKSTETNPKELVKKLSFGKADSVFNEIKNKYSDVTVIGADTIVYFNNQFLGKPKDEKNAIQMLTKLQGKSHDVYTGMTVIIRKNSEIKYENVFSKSTIYFKEMSSKDILEYVKTKEPLDKAGSYAIQGIGSKYIHKYTGDFNTIVGLDINKLEKILKDNKIL